MKGRVDHTLELRSDITLRAKHGIRITLNRRNPQIAQITQIKDSSQGKVSKLGAGP